MQDVSQPAAAPNLAFSHMGISVSDIARMEDFYTRVLGFTVTDRGQAAGMEIVFLSRDPLDHHQIVLATGRPAVLLPNTANPQFGPSINQISFRMGTLEDLRQMYGTLQHEGATGFLPANHGAAWSLYAHDPEGNNLEFFVDTDWFVSQPYLIPLDFSKNNDEIREETRLLCQRSAGFEPIGDWRRKISQQMNHFRPPESAALE